MKNFLKTIIFLGVILSFWVKESTTAFSMEEKKDLFCLSIFEVPNSDFFRVQENMKGLQGKCFLPQEILVVSDVNGTLSRAPTAEIGMRAQPKGENPEIFEKLIKEGCLGVVSSACRDFSQTLQTIGELKLNKVLRMTEEGTQTNLELKEGLIGVYNGFVSSVRSVESKEKEYLEKAFSPFYVFSSSQLEKIRAIVFCDDNPDNIMTFKKTIQEKGQDIYPNLQELFLHHIR